jgi:hypothetical protein
MRNLHNILARKPEDKRQLRRPMRRRQDNIKTYLKNIGCKNVDWVYLAQNRGEWCAHVNTVMNLRVP